MNPSLIDQLVQARGIESQYIDAWGKHTIIEQESKQSILAAMGYPMDDEAKLVDAINQEVEQNLLTVAQPVIVARIGQQVDFHFNLPIDFVNDELELAIMSGDKPVYSHKFVPVESELLASSEVNDIEIQHYKVTINVEFDMGYYDFNLLEANIDEPLGQGRLIVAPKQCYKQQALKEGKKLWGPSVQLYCVKSKRNWGVGDFTDLKYLIDKIADRGADFVGLNPIHALYPNNPNACSPYSPSSRRWLNIIYIDVESVWGFNEDSETQKIVNDKEFQQQLTQAKSTDWVDYSSVMDLKLRALKPLYQFFVKHHLAKETAEAQRFQHFKDVGCDSLKQQATFDAIQEHYNVNGRSIEQNWGWPVWPKEMQDYDSQAVQQFVENNPALVDFYMFLQFVANEQIEQVEQLSIDKGMAIGTYRDLAVGVSEGSTEIWANKDLYKVDASVGAPPDVLGPLGQNWGLPPMDPNQLYQQAYQPIVDLFRSNMHACGALRIDHVMALLRLWWVPKGESATKGTYVYYPVDDLLAILALESHLNQCSIIGEDLGTVPGDIIGKLQENGVHSYKVFFFERAPDGGFYSPKHYIEQAMATLTTHDMPTLIGYWHCKDLELGQKLGLYKGEELISSLYESRANDKQQILNSLHGHGAISATISQNAAEVPMSKELNYGLQVHMAKGNSALLSLQLEDWLQMDQPVNVPGTSSEYPNWRRKLSVDLEDIFTMSDVNDLTDELTKARRQT